MRSAYARYVALIGREPAPMTADYAALIARGEVWVATQDACPGAVLVGVLVLRPQPPALLLDNVAVLPAWQRRGIGRALLAYAESQARQQGLSEVTLYTNAKMVDNQRLYAALGYVETDRRVEAGFSRVFFRKPL